MYDIKVISPIPGQHSVLVPLPLFFEIPKVKEPVPLWFISKIGSSVTSLWDILAGSRTKINPSEVNDNFRFRFLTSRKGVKDFWATGFDGLSLEVEHRSLNLGLSEGSYVTRVNKRLSIYITWSKMRCPAHSFHPWGPLLQLLSFSVSHCRVQHARVLIINCQWVPGNGCRNLLLNFNCKQRVGHRIMKCATFLSPRTNCARWWPWTTLLVMGIILFHFG